MELCWKGAGAHLKPKNLKLEVSKTDEASTSHNDATNKQTTSILKNPKKLDLPRLQIIELLRVRQCIISDLSNIYYAEHYTSLKETPSADWQQQMSFPPTFSTTLDPTSKRLQTDAISIRFIALIDDKPFSLIVTEK